MQVWGWISPLVYIIVLAGISDKGLVHCQSKRKLAVERKPVVPNTDTKVGHSILYNRLLTPTDLKEFASARVHSADFTTRLEITKSGTQGLQRVLRIPILPPSQLTPSQPYYVQVSAGLDQSRTSQAFSTMFSLSDGSHVTGFVLPGTEDRSARVLCYGMEADEDSPAGLDRPLSRYRLINRTPSDDDDDDDASSNRVVIVSNLGARRIAPVNETTILFKPGRDWGSCSAVEYSTFRNVVGFSRHLNPRKGLFFDVHLSRSNGRLNLLYLLIKLVRESSLI
uniref:Uncharacterized protein 18 n=1 Tax=Halisarca dujardinii TaxID=2583056 RepID=A0AA96MMD7_HALDU|nr:uncharacterized protein 18 [Halisarca dujardinii]